MSEYSENDLQTSWQKLNNPEQLQQQGTLLNIEDIHEIIEDAQYIVGEPPIFTTFWIARLSEMKDPMRQTVIPMTELTSYHAALKLGEGVVQIGLPDKFSSAQSELEVTAHEIAHAMVATATAKYVQDKHVGCCITETVCDLVGLAVRQRIMEENTIPGITADIELVQSDMELDPRDVEQFFAQDANTISDEGPGHVLARKLARIIKPNLPSFDRDTIAKAVHVLLHHPPTRAELLQPQEYGEKLAALMSAVTVTGKTVPVEVQVHGATQKKRLI